MANIHFKKKLVHQATIQRSTPVQSGSGELIEEGTWANVDTIDCRYVQREERIAQESTSLQMIQQDLLLMDTGEDVIEEDRVINIVWKVDSTSVDVGPFTIERLLDRNTGKSHHISAMLERIE